MEQQLIFFTITLLLLFSAEAHNVWRENNTTQGAQINIQYARKGQKICMKDLECFELTADFFHPLYRPFNFLPNDRKTINTRFHLFTKQNPKEYWDINANNLENIKQSPIDPTKKTKFIVHGFVDNKFYGKWMEILKDNLLLHNEYNVLIVDWSGGNGPPYTQASANARVVGAEIAHLIRVLESVKHVSPMDCHIIGHSLGSHAAGYAGKRLSKLGRISGVDPAEPFFQNMPHTVRIDKTDAHFVDVIHSDSTTILLLGLGMSQAVGHVDFYPNGGKNQPGCKTDVIRSIFLEGLVDATRRFIACNHQRAVDFYTYSINYHKATPVGFRCSSWEEFLEGKCADCGNQEAGCAIMGLRADEYKGEKNTTDSLKLYLSTSGSAPYWVFHYHIVLKLLKPKTKFQDQEGKVSLTIHGEYETINVNLNPNSIALIHGATYKFLVTTGKELGEIKSLTLIWHSSSWNPLRFKAIHVEYIKLLLLSTVHKVKQKNYKTFKGKSEKEIKSGIAVSLLEI